MSPSASRQTSSEVSFPRPRGDEPVQGSNGLGVQVVFPAHAGMSRGRFEVRYTGPGFPRPRGDEPASGGTDGDGTVFSPPTRG